ncbi:MAG: hypothetical protein E7B34_30865, partial [Hafnia alvei]|nr:hypothetical protein [Hafnia alvei]
MGGGIAAVIHGGGRQRHISLGPHAASGWRDDFPATDVQVCLRFNIAEGDFSGRSQGNIPLGGGNAV